MVKNDYGEEMLGGPKNQLTRRDLLKMGFSSAMVTIIMGTAMYGCPGSTSSGGSTGSTTTTTKPTPTTTTTTLPPTTTTTTKPSYYNTGYYNTGYYNYYNTVYYYNYFVNSWG